MQIMFEQFLVTSDNVLIECHLVTRLFMKNICFNVSNMFKKTQILYLQILCK